MEICCHFHAVLPNIRHVLTITLLMNIDFMLKIMIKS
ncbi:hypothetical protein RDI58_026950 [Solanum bulbocastanum]|uniref:Uncharacterized protein n=1 Tax=Solanum bulbocastanum TaxID=147425 RepID=A0AAN8SV34_SOLBU